MHVVFQAPTLLPSSFKWLLVLSLQMQSWFLMCLAPEKKTHKCLCEFGLSLFIYSHESFSFWEVQNCGPKRPGSVVHSTTSRGSLLIFKGDISSVSQRLVSLSPHWRLMRPLLQVASSSQRSPFLLLPDGSWRGCTADSQTATAGELEQFDWWSKGVRKSFCTHKMGACPPGASASQALLHCPRLNKLCFMVVLNASSSFHGIQEKKKKVIKIQSGYLQTVFCAGNSLVISWFCLCPLQAEAAQPSAPHSSSSCVVLELQWSKETVG